MKYAMCAVLALAFNLPEASAQWSSSSSSRSRSSIKQREVSVQVVAPSVKQVRVVQPVQQIKIVEVPVTRREVIEVEREVPVTTIQKVRVQEEREVTEIQRREVLVQSSKVAVSAKSYNDYPQQNQRRGILSRLRGARGG